MPTKTLDCSMYDLTPLSPTMPMQYPAARAVRPTESPHARCMNPLGCMSACCHVCPLPSAGNPLKQAVVGPGGRRLQVLGDEDGDDERIDGENTGHDDGDEALSRAGQRGASLEETRKQAFPPS